MIGTARRIAPRRGRIRPGRRSSPPSLGSGARRAALGLCSLLLGALLTGPAAAEAPRAVVVARGTASARLHERVRSEIGALGWRVIDAKGPASLPEAARRSRASAALRLGRGHAELWTESADPSETAPPEMLPVRDDEDESVAAFRIVELLRARLLRLGPSLDPPSAAPATRAPGSAGTEEPPPDARRGLWMGAASVLGIGGGGLGPTLHVEVGGRWAARRWSFALSGLLPVTTSRISAPEGSADVRLTLAGLTTDYIVELGTGAQALLGATVGGAHMRSAGRAHPPFRDRVDTVLVAAALAHAALAQPLGRIAALRLDVRAGATAPRPVVKFDDRVQASWGRPVAMVGLGFELSPF